MGVRCALGMAVGWAPWEQARSSSFLHPALAGTQAGRYMVCGVYGQAVHAFFQQPLIPQLLPPAELICSWYFPDKLLLHGQASAEAGLAPPLLEQPPWSTAYLEGTPRS